MKPYYDRDGITIWHGRCEDVLPTVDPATVDLLLTDPPYGIDLDTNTSTRFGQKKWPGKVRERVHGDNAPFDPSPLIAFQRAVLFGANHYADKLPASPSWLVWDRQSGDSNTADAELAWTNLGGTVRTYRHLWNGLCRQSEVGFHVHPTQKPVSLMRWIVDRWTEPGDLVLGPYMGSGPVAQACHELGRRYVGIELVEDYCRVAVSRLSQQTLQLEVGP